jgi:hypothetical protein
MNRVDEICKELEREADLESDDILCDKKIEEFECTRPMGHSGFHISMAMGPNIIVMWNNVLSN